MNNNHVEVNLENIAYNVLNIKKKFNNYKYYIGVVKGNAYGHGYEIANTLIENGINYLAVSDFDEAIKLKKILKYNIPILIMTPIDIDCLDMYIENNFTIIISNYAFYQKLKQTNKKIKVHLALNTGMNRLGIDNQFEVTEIYNDLNRKDSKIKLEGIYTHMATLGITDTYWDKQLQAFKYLTKNIDLSKIEIVHIACSTTLIVHPKIDFCNAVRIGSLLYGIAINPINNQGIISYLKKIKRTFVRKIKHISPINSNFEIALKQALTLYSKVIEIKNIKSGSYIGYNNSYQIKDNAKLAIVGIGYANGLPYHNVNRQVIINGNYYSIVGATNMNMITVIVDDKVKINDQVIILNNLKDTKKVANLCGVNSLFLFTSIPENMPRLYLSKKEF